MNWTFSVPPRILFGPGSAAQAGGEVAALGAGSALLVTDAGVVGAGLDRQVVDSLSACGVRAIVFSGVRPKPPVFDADAAVQQARRAGGVDAVVGLGGGSAMDVAKVVAAALGCDAEACEFLQPGGRAVSRRLPLVLLPTTAGTGSEVTPVSILMGAEGVERAARDKRLVPDAAVVDPRLTLTLPAGLTAASGVDALAHAIESYTGRAATPLTEQLALRALEAIARGLPQAAANGDDIGARTEVMLGSLLAGVSFANAYNALAHACAGAICSAHPVPHALAVAAVLPGVEEFNFPAGREKFITVARLLGAPQVAEAGGLGAVLRGFIESVGAPHSLAAAGVRQEEVGALAKKALESTLAVGNNPRQASPRDVESILQGALRWA